MKVLRTAAAIALLVAPAYLQFAAPAHAQAPHINMMPDMPSKTQEEKDADDARDKAYKESLRKIPDAKTSNDPWGVVRSDAPKAAAPAKTASSTAKAKPKAKVEAKTGAQ